MKNKIEEKISKFIKETEISNLVAPELNVDRDRATWLKKQGKKGVEGLSETSGSVIQVAGVSEQQTMKRFTGYVRWKDGENEEVDVDAIDTHDAGKKIEKLLKTDYRPGGRIIQIKQRFGLYM